MATHASVDRPGLLPGQHGGSAAWGWNLRARPHLGAGRRFLADRLGTLARAEIRTLFESARFPQHDGEDVEAWVDVFQDKVREISAGPPCPAR